MKSAILKQEQFITDANGKRVGVLLDLKSYRRLKEAEEDLADIHAYDAAVPKIQAEVAAGQFATLTEYQAKRSRKGK